MTDPLFSHRRPAPAPAAAAPKAGAAPGRRRCTLRFPAAAYTAGRDGEG
ncbi:Hypothetical protein I596_948 [Dokdonella koreensis DS-123]|uniref:Uncharacterized protein n=1 Tax=Dokdonella koreensis DS-123 TaxID=1300342 RepID=A0A160DRX0_9GAMM|nr:Hypothetical protein I596_948 [Dokdonella koreensis DS-123]